MHRRRCVRRPTRSQRPDCRESKQNVPYKQQQQHTFIFIYTYGLYGGWPPQNRIHCAISMFCGRRKGNSQLRNEDWSKYENKCGCRLAVLPLMYMAIATKVNFISNDEMLGTSFVLCCSICYSDLVDSVMCVCFSHSLAEGLMSILCAIVTHMRASIFENERSGMDEE